jgi:threonine dehydratase
MTTQLPIALAPPTLDELRDAAVRIRGYAARTPLLRLNIGNPPAEIWLKLENLQPIGAFKIRGAANAILQVDPARLAEGLYTASAGNMAQGVGWMARALGVPFTTVVPDHAPEAKLGAIRGLGGRIIPVPFDEWWRVLVERAYPGLDGLFVHPVSDPAVIAGNGTIGLELVEDLSDFDAVVVPYGGGGLSCGIASALRALAPRVKVFAAEVETSAALCAAFAAGAPANVDYTPSFVDGIGSGCVLQEMWPLARNLIHDSLVVSLRQVAAAIRLLADRAHVVAEGAGAAPVAAALTGLAGGGKVVCIVSGGNIDSYRLATILRGETPQ